MKTLYAAIISAALLSTMMPALADSTIDVSKLTCKKFNDDNRGLIMMWFEGYYTEESEPATIDFGKMAGHLARLLIDCAANPDKNVLDLADEAMND